MQLLVGGGGQQNGISKPNTQIAPCEFGAEMGLAFPRGTGKIRRPGYVHVTGGLVAGEVLGSAQLEHARGRVLAEEAAGRQVEHHRHGGVARGWQQGGVGAPPVVDTANACVLRASWLTQQLRRGVGDEQPVRLCGTGARMREILVGVNPPPPARWESVDTPIHSVTVQRKIPLVLKESSDPKN